MNTTYETPIIDVLVVGAGPAGLTLACDLARRGKTIRIIDRLQTPPVGTRARGLSPRTLEIFEDLGLLAGLLQYAEPALPWRIYGRDNQVVREIDPASTANAPLPPTPDEPYRSFVQVSQRHTDAALREHLSTYGLRITWDCQFTEFQEYDDYVVAQVVHEGRRETIRARYLVGCDGGHSTVRAGANISFEGSALEDSPSIFANVAVSTLSPLYWHFWTDPHPQPAWGMTLQPMVHEDTWLFSTNIAPDKEGALPAPTLETIQHLFDERVGLPDVHFSRLTWFSTNQLNGRIARHYRKGRIFLAGDAAHVGIAGGQGMNIAIQDVYNLGWKLALVLDGGPEVLLDTYEAERLPQVQRFLAATSAHYATGRGSGGEQSITKLRDFASALSQLSLTYHNSALSRDLDASTGIRAGNRAPDAPVLRNKSSEQVRLFDLFQGTHFTLLAFGEQPAPPLPASYRHILHAYNIMRPGDKINTNDETIIDKDGYTFSAYGITDRALILVRPDGYVGLTSGNVDLQPIIDYLQLLQPHSASPDRT
jgi:2-polyprenyl-6-methoxyphenol hydroxylase-like FAD-dependent oxidoreductase